MSNYTDPHFESLKIVAAILGGSLVGFMIAYSVNPNLRDYVESHLGYSANKVTLNKIV